MWRRGKGKGKGKGEGKKRKKCEEGIIQCPRAALINKCSVISVYNRYRKSRGCVIVEGHKLRAAADKALCVRVADIPKAPALVKPLLLLRFNNATNR